MQRDRGVCMVRDHGLLVNWDPQWTLEPLEGSGTQGPGTPAGPETPADHGTHSLTRRARVWSGSGLGGIYLPCDTVVGCVAVATVGVYCVASVATLGVR